MKPLFIFLLLFSESILAQKLEVDGHYQGRNIYVQNPLSDSGTVYCIQKIIINSTSIPLENTAAITIHLDSLHFKIGDSIHVEIYHHNNCLPKILIDNTDRKFLFEVVSIGVDSVAVLHWICKNEQEKYAFIIEQFKWNKWVKIGQVEGIGGTQENKYSFQTLPHSGKNQFRIKQTYVGNTSRYSRTVDYKAPDWDVKIMNNTYRIDRTITFSKETDYEVYDYKGDVVKRGRSNTIDLKGLAKGSYYLNYDNKMMEFTKFY
jgi:hypothetical protein